MTKTSFVIGPRDVVLAILDNSYDNSPDGKFNAVIIDRGSNTHLNVGARCDGFNTFVWTPVTLDMSFAKVPTFSEKCEGLPTDDLAEAYNLFYPSTRSDATTRVQKATHMKRLFKGQDRLIGSSMDQMHKLITFLEAKLAK